MSPSPRRASIGRGVAARKSGRCSERFPGRHLHRLRPLSRWTWRSRSRRCSAANTSRVEKYTAPTRLARFTYAGKHSQERQGASKQLLLITCGTSGGLRRIDIPAGARPFQEVQLVLLPEQLGTEVAMLAFAGEWEAGSLVQVPDGRQRLVGPAHESAVGRPTGDVHARMRNRAVVSSTWTQQ